MLSKCGKGRVQAKIQVQVPGSTLLNPPKGKIKVLQIKQVHTTVKNKINIQIHRKVKTGEVVTKVKTNTRTLMIERI